MRSGLKLQECHLTSQGLSPCTFKVCKASSDICQIRLNFESLSLGQPSTSSVLDSNPNSRGQCQEDQFTATSDGPAPPVLCGSNTGQHMILEAREDCNTITVTWGTSGTLESRTWNIHISQLSCQDPWAPPQGCLQYFTGTAGEIFSYNYQGGLHLASQVRQWSGEPLNTFLMFSFTPTASDRR